MEEESKSPPNILSDNPNEYQSADILGTFDKVQNKEKQPLGYIIGQEEGKRDLLEGITLLQESPHLWPKTLLLYGPKGSGKDYLIEMVVKEADCRVVAIDCPKSEEEWNTIRPDESQTFEEWMISTYVENSDETNKIIVIRNIENLTVDPDECIRRACTQFLIITGGIPDPPHYITILTTESPWDVRDSIVRKANKRIYCKLPNRDERLSMLKNDVPNLESFFTPEEIEKILDSTEDYGYSDISQQYLKKT
ncbi:unnamed protein product [Moneuplotes crassus]|uniref:ATPase AAA-type core domain-containing protein n=1 Tax=Euplotes crassus TaxID=5936 RepID=A0AAD1UKT4_EUPCR|nr:unnamed protein product [Moneuplotes crassus]